MLGSAMAAEDIVQEAYLRYRATPPESIRTLKSFLTTVVHHLCLDHLKSGPARRETYVGPWLPEPIITGDGASLISPLHQITDRESISMAFLVLLESLSPLERAVFLLREVFDYEYAEIGEMNGRLSLRAQDVTAWIDNGGKVSAGARQRVQGRDEVACGIIRHLSRV